VREGRPAKAKKIKKCGKRVGRGPLTLKKRAAKPREEVKAARFLSWASADQSEPTVSNDGAFGV
jgi:hypothetical protein